MKVKGALEKTHNFKLSLEFVWTWIWIFFNFNYINFNWVMLRLTTHIAR